MIIFLENSYLWLSIWLLKSFFIVQFLNDIQTVCKFLSDQLVVGELLCTESKLGEHNHSQTAILGKILKLMCNKFPQTHCTVIKLYKVIIHLAKKFWKYSKIPQLMANLITLTK